MIKRLFSILVLTCLTIAVCGQQWPEAKPEAKPGARWWWLGSAVDKANLNWAMQEYANHGIGALEITPIYGVQGNQTNNIPYLSERWMEMLRFTEEQGLKNNIEIDMATGTGWPFGGPWVPMEESACKAVFVDTTFIGNSIEGLDLSAPEKDAKYCKLCKVMAYWQGEPYDVTAFVKDGKLTWSPAAQLKAKLKAAKFPSATDMPSTNKTKRKAMKLKLKEMIIFLKQSRFPARRRFWF